MKENLISIKINKPIKKVFEFTINPKNTHIWINSIKKEWINEEKIKLWVIYKNHWTNSKIIDSYELIEFKENKKFKLKSLNSSYEVSYFYHEIDKNSCILNYFEEMTDLSELINPFEIKTLKKLKINLEKINK